MKRPKFDWNGRNKDGAVRRQGYEPVWIGLQEIKSENVRGPDISKSSWDSRPKVTKAACENNLQEKRKHKPLTRGELRQINNVRQKLAEKYPEKAAKFAPIIQQESDE